MARPDRFWEPFIEYHGLLQGLLEVCVRKKEPEIYKQLAGGIISFSRSWMKIHNPKMQKTVTDLLSPLEFCNAGMPELDQSGNCRIFRIFNEHS